MTPDEIARDEAILDGFLENMTSWEQKSKARAEQSLRLKIKSHIALERMRQANEALREALPH
jgi:hypothetical protein